MVPAHTRYQPSIAGEDNCGRVGGEEREREHVDGEGKRGEEEELNTAVF